MIEKGLLRYSQIQYCGYCLSHYRDSKKALSLSPNLVKDSVVKEANVTVFKI